MKTFFTSIVLVFAVVMSSVAQINTGIKEESKPNSKGSFNALVMDLPGVSAKEAQKAWSKYAKKLKGRTKYERRANEYITDDATIKDMSDNTVDIIAKVEEQGDGSRISLWFNLGVSYLSSKDFPERYPAGEKILRDFARTVSADMIEAELKEAEKELKTRENDLQKLEKEEKQRTKDIEDYKNTIQKMEANIKTAEGDIQESKDNQEKKKTDIEEQKKVVEEIKKRLESVK